MSDNVGYEEEASQLTATHHAVTEDGEDVTKRLRISPRRILGSLIHLRIDKARIKPMQGRAPKAGGNADVEAAILASAKSSSSSESGDEEYVAVKKLRFDEDTDDDHALAPLAYEVNLLNDLSHENIAKIVGFVEDVGHQIAWMVFAWEKNGNLREFVQSTNWELPERVSLISDIAKGLSYLHGKNPPICHGDLKSLNIIVNSENRALLTDFGSARPVDSEALKDISGTKVTPTPPSDQIGVHGMEEPTAELAPSGDSITMTGPAWTIRWAAPELLGGHLPSLASDIWALGWICWEAVTGNFPFDKDNNVVAIVRITKGDLPNFETSGEFKQIKALCSLMRECWKLDTKKRPTAAKCQQIVSFMDQTVPSQREEGSLTRSARLLFALGRIELRNSMFSEARKYFEHSLKVAESVGDESEMANVLRAIGDVYYQLGDYSKAEESYIRACDIFSRIGNQLGYAQSVNSLGDVYRMRDEYSKAEESYIQARDIYSQIRNLAGFAESADSLGDVYYMRIDYSQAEESYSQARDIYSRIGDQLGLAQAVKRLGDVYRMGNEYSKAEESYIQARDIHSQIGNQLGFAQSVKTLGDVYRMQNEYSKAEESYNQARDIYSQIGAQLGYAQSFEGMGKLHAARGENAMAEEAYSEAQRIYNRIGDKYSSATILWHLGSLHRDQAQYTEAERLFREASTIYGELGMEQWVGECNDIIDEIHQLTE
ncbi:hypothetical protein FS837_012359 [Tulasnella sp. UAMH 9824]|nr:hypothetical protein FS837_012359 [Tulasnella sp. UAMH 9824]